MTKPFRRPAWKQVLMPIFDLGFSESNFGFRPGGSAQGALRQLQQHLREGRRITVDAGRSWGLSMAYRLTQLTKHLRGWMNYFGVSDCCQPIPELGWWIRMAHVDHRVVLLGHA